MGDVLEYLIDGTSGLAPGGVEGSAIVCGVCSRGEIGKGYIIGRSSDLPSLLGIGPLVDKVKDVLATAGQEPVIVAVPCQGEAGSIGTVKLVENVEVDGVASPLISFEGEVKAAAQIVVKIVKGGERNVATFQISYDGADNFMPSRTVPIDGDFDLLDYGVTLNFPSGTYRKDAVYSCELLAPEPSIVSVMEALETPLNLYDIEFVYVAAPSDSVDWAAAQVKADELWALHRPTYFKMEARLPRADEDLHDYVAYLLAERQNFAGRFVQVIAQFGEVTETGGHRHFRSFAGLQAGRTLAIPVQRASGRVRDGGISGVSLVEGWDTVQPVLENAGFVTAKKYAGLQCVYWGDSRTMADDTSDFRFEEVVRVAFKATRKMRIAALKSMHDEAGDPTLGENSLGLAYLQANLENSLDTMVKAIPTELASYVVNIPKGQDIVNNGVAVETSLIGIPIIRQIKLFTNYTYAGSSFDPRIKERIYGN